MILKDLQMIYGDHAIGQVVRITSNHSLIVDAGYNLDLKIDDKVQVYEYIGKLTDANGKEIAPLEYVKAELIVVRVEELYSICETGFYVSETDLRISPLLHRERKHYVFKTKEEDILPLIPQNPFVSLGDPVKKG